MCLLKSYDLLVKELDAKGKQYAKLPKPGRTHLQGAVPIMLGRKFKAYSAVLKRDMRDIKRAMKDLTSVNLGGTAIGTSLNAQPAYMKNVAKAALRSDKSLHDVVVESGDLSPKEATRLLNPTLLRC